MASFDDIFNSSKSDVARFPKWENEGDTIIGLINGEIDVHHQQTDFASKKPAFLVKTGSSATASGWEKKGGGMFDTSLDHFKLTQVRVPVEVQVKDDDNYSSYFDFPEGSAKYDALKMHMMDSGLPLVEGTAIAVKLLDKTTKPYTWIVKLKAPQK